MKKSRFQGGERDQAKRTFPEEGESMNRCVDAKAFQDLESPCLTSSLAEPEMEKVGKTKSPLIR